jgi:hypothetical protein
MSSAAAKSRQRAAMPSPATFKRPDPRARADRPCGNFAPRRARPPARLLLHPRPRARRFERVGSPGMRCRNVSDFARAGRGLIVVVEILVDRPLRPYLSSVASRSCNCAPARSTLIRPRWPEPTMAAPSIFPSCSRCVTRGARIRPAPRQILIFGRLPRGNSEFRGSGEFRSV